ncbi:hypothetical protein BC830DRAFT_1061289 [Chytriomyces sp. MP71]|nr:hypothetical protein BC830DRAFT_1061289 [Chytriomyces sp. MP71]
MGSASQSDPLGELEAVNAREQYRVTKRAMHKEVERRRRDVISMGIEQLAELLPVQEKKKGRVVQGAVQYIRELKQIESSNLEKWQVEKSLCEQA